MTCIIKNIDESKVAWCGFNTSGCVAFIDVAHFVLGRSNGSIWGHPVCSECLSKVMGILEEEKEAIETPTKVC